MSTLSPSERYKALIKRDGDACKKCGKQKKRYDNHHIDWDGNNNDLSNLALLCRKHHGRIHGYTRHCYTGIPKEFILSCWEKWIKMGIK